MKSSITSFYQLVNSSSGRKEFFHGFGSEKVSKEEIKEVIKSLKEVIKDRGKNVRS